jgi:hypothetical protein
MKYEATLGICIVDLHIRGRGSRGNEVCCLPDLRVDDSSAERKINYMTQSVLFYQPITIIMITFGLTSTEKRYFCPSCRLVTKLKSPS